ncbi:MULTISPECIES: hypothetical protein [Streptomyces]|nr:hypothetical protein [Streptomyces virginiae]
MNVQPRKSVSLAKWELELAERLELDWDLGITTWTSGTADTKHDTDEIEF